MLNSLVMNRPNRPTVTKCHFMTDYFVVLTEFLSSVVAAVKVIAV